MSIAIFGAIDLGASSGRVMAGVFSDDGLDLVEIARFPNGPIELDGKLFWDFNALFKAIKAGLLQLGEFAAARNTRVISVGIDTWAVDYALVAADGQLLATPRHYRDERNLLGVGAVHGIVSQEELYQYNGLQYLPFNTLYQLAAEQLQNAELLAQADKMLLIPDLIAFLLTGERRAEVTNASTTGLLDVRTHQWNTELCERLRISTSLLPDLIQPGESYGLINNTDVSHPALAETQIVAVASHDTASAVLAVPNLDANGAYLSSGTWSLIGVETDAPVLNDNASKANFTNELGVNSKTRFLKNLSGLWLIQESIRTWNEAGNHINVVELVEDARKVTTAARINVNDPEFAAPGNMPSRIQVHVSRNGGRAPQSPAEIARCVFESLADAYAEALDEIELATGRKVNRLNIVGGGSQNELLSQLAADRCGIEVLAGPVEATAIGNLMAQVQNTFKSLGGHDLTTLAGQRAFVNANFTPKQYSPKQQSTNSEATK